MTTVSLQRLNEQRLQKLKYRNIKWITVPSSSYKFTPRYGESALASSRSERSRSSLPQNISKPNPKTPYFKSSEVSFTEPEIQVLREADYTNTAKSIQKRSSQLEQLQAQKIENEKYLQLSSSSLTSRSRIKLIPSLESDVHEIPRSDSVISLKPIDLDEDDDSSKNDPTAIQNHDSSYNVFNSSTVTIDDIKEHVWMWCHENDDEDLKKTVKHCNAQFIEQEFSPSVQTPEQYQQQQQQLKYQFQQHRRQRQLIEKQKHHDQEQRQKQQQLLQQSPSDKSQSILSVKSSVSILDESFYSPENRFLEAQFNYSLGEKKLRNIIKSHSKIERDREEVKRRFQRKHVPNKNTENIGSSYCAYKYQKYLFDKVGDVPDYLDEVDFTEAKKINANLRKNKARVESSDDIIDAVTPQKTPRKTPK